MPELPFTPTGMLETALAAASAGAEVVSHHFQRLHETEIRAKSGGEKSYDLVTNADLASEHAIVDVIRQRSPQDHEILGEEQHQGDADAAHLWVIDPLDGTNNFAHELPHFAVSVAYVQQGRPRCGVVLNPVSGLCCICEHAAGSWRRTETGWERCRVTTARSLSESLVGVGFYYDRDGMMRNTLAAMEEFFGQEIHGIRRFGAAALDLCMVGCGQLGAFFEYQLSPWDFAAGWLFVEEAGGVVTQCDGQPLSVARSSVLAASPELHQSSLGIVGRHLPF